MNILVTGGAGFIGSSFIRLLINNLNYKILNIDKLSYAANLEILKEFELFPNYKFIKEDISNYFLLNKTIKKFKPNWIINFAAETHVDNSIKNSDEFINSNYLGTLNLIKSSQSFFENLNEENKKKFIFFQISTDEVYGFLKKNEKKFTENDKFKPSSPYSATKAGADHLVYSWHLTYGLPIIISHCSNNYGPYQNKEKLIPKIIINCIKKKKIPVYGNGKNIREWLFVEDHVNAILYLLNYGKVGERYNIGSNIEYENIKLIKKMCNMFDKITKSNYDSKKLITFVKDRPGHDLRYALNTNKINKLGWKSTYDFEKSMKDTIFWYLKKFKK